MAAELVEVRVEEEPLSRRRRTTAACRGARAAYAGWPARARCPSGGTPARCSSTSDLEPPKGDHQSGRLFHDTRADRPSKSDRGVVAEMTEIYKGGSSCDKYLVSNKCHVVSIFYGPKIARDLSICF
jgi:hypothetical protein